jgi:hypothetical protein
MLVEQFGGLLRRHRDPRGILVATSRDFAAAEPETYASIVAKLEGQGRWLPNISREEGATGAALERSEIPLPDVPKSRRVELYLLSPARAMRELGLREPPLRVAASDRETSLSPREAVRFYAPHLKEKGFTTKHRVWSDGSTEQLVGHTDSHHVIVHAERQRDGRTFVRLAWIAKTGLIVPAGKSVTLAGADASASILVSKSATSWEEADAVIKVRAGTRARVLASRKIGKEGKTILRYEVEIAATKERGWVHREVVRSL